MRNLLLVIVPKKPRILVKVAETFISILIESGVLSLASVAIPTIFDRGSWLMVVLGTIGTFAFWIGAILISWRIQ